MIRPLIFVHGAMYEATCLTISSDAYTIEAKIMRPFVILWSLINDVFAGIKKICVTEINQYKPYGPAVIVVYD